MIGADWVARTLLDFPPGVGPGGILPRSLRLRGAQLSRWWSLAEEADELSQVLRGGGEQEFVFRAAQSSQSQPAKVEVALEMRETHLNLLSQSRRAFVSWGFPQRLKMNLRGGLVWRNQRLAERDLMSNAMG